MSVISELKGWRETRKFFKTHPSYYYRQKESPKYAGVVIMCIVLAILLVLLVGVCGAEEIGEASYYTIASCLKESGQYQMANGQMLNDSALTCASWQYKFGTKLLIVNKDNGKSVIVSVTDRGPAKRLVRQGRIIDLSKGAFLALASLDKGIIRVKVEKI